jgi:hypothetical protein
VTLFDNASNWSRTKHTNTRVFLTIRIKIAVFDEIQKIEPSKGSGYENGHSTQCPFLLKEEDATKMVVPKSFLEQIDSVRYFVACVCVFVPISD